MRFDDFGRFTAYMLGAKLATLENLTDHQRLAENLNGSNINHSDVQQVVGELSDCWQQHYSTSVFIRKI